MFICRHWIWKILRETGWSEANTAVKQNTVSAELRHSSFDGRRNDSQLLHQCPELLWEERLGAIGERFVGIIMHLDDDCVSPSGHGRTSHRRDLVSAASPVRRIAANGQM